MLRWWCIRARKVTSLPSGSSVTSRMVRSSFASMAKPYLARVSSSSCCIASWSSSFLLSSISSRSACSLSALVSFLAFLSSVRRLALPVLLLELVELLRVWPLAKPFPLVLAP